MYFIPDSITYQQFGLKECSIYLKAPIVIEDFYLNGHERILDCHREALIPYGIQFPVHRPGLVDYPATIFEFDVGIARAFNNKYLLFRMQITAPFLFTERQLSKCFKVQLRRELNTATA